MKVYEHAKTPFLKSMEVCFRKLGECGFHFFNIDNEETMVVLLSEKFPDVSELKDGILHLQGNKWKRESGIFEEPPPEDISITLTARRKICISNADNGRPYLESLVNSYSEFEEILLFFNAANIDLINCIQQKEKTLSDLIQSVSLMFPPTDSVPESMEGVKILISDLLKLKGNSALFEALDLLIRSPWSNSLETIKEKNNEPLGKLFRSTSQLDDEDIIINPFGEICYKWMVQEELLGLCADSPHIVLTPKKSASVLWINDILRYGTEFEEEAYEFLGTWKTLPDVLKKLSLKIPATKTAQTADAILRRNARQRYLDTLNSAMRVREPFDKMTRIYEMRAEAAKALHNEFLEEIVASQKPLPFFIEYPYRAFLKADDTLEKIKCGQRLLGIFAKIPLFLAIEELIANNSQLGAEYLDKIKAEKPLSDGGFLNLQTELSRAIHTSDSKLSVFAGLVSVMADCDSLKVMVTARNRMHHEPYDEEGFVEVMTEEAPKLIAHYRDSLSDLNFVIPKGIRIEDGKTILTAEDITGCDGFFRERDFPISGPLDVFENGKIVAFAKNGTQALKLSFLLNAQQKTKRIIDFGIFDRMKPGGPEYTLLRD